MGEQESAAEGYRGTAGPPCPGDGVVELFNWQDEEDDLHGVKQDSRVEIPRVLEAMYDHIHKLNHRFLIIFQNGSSEEINLSIFGFPLSGYSRNKVLWTFQGRFRLFPRLKVDGAMTITKATDVFLSASQHEKDPQELRSYLVHQEAVESAPRNQPSQVAEYFLYMWNLCCMSYHFRVDYDFNTHCCNYWICDGILQHQLRQQREGDNVATSSHDDDELWHAAGALQREMRLDVDYYNHSHHQSLPSHLTTMASMPHCASPSHGVLGLLLIPARDMLRHFNKLGVLKLSHCSFSFSSPPFLCCSSLRFLWLDHCQDQVISTVEEGDEENIRRCFKRLWVLDVRYTPCDRILSAQMLDFMTQLRELNVIGAQDLDVGQLHGCLPNIRKLRVTKSAFRCSGHSEQDLFQGMNKMELLDFSGNRGDVVSQLNGIITNSSNQLETVVIVDGCVGKQKFSFRECAKMKNILLWIV